MYLERRDFLKTAFHMATVAATGASLSLLPDRRPSAPLPPERLVKSEVSEVWKRALGMGVNVTDWFRFQPGVAAQTRLSTDAHHLQNFIGDEELVLMKQIGITSVRLPVSAHWLFGDQSGNNLGYVSNAIGKFESNGIKTILSMHDADPRAIEKLAYADEYVTLWGKVVKGLAKKHDANTLALEPVNEPVYDKNPRAWNGLQRRLLEETRKYAKDHIFIAKPANWSRIEALPDLTPLCDPKVIYSVHCWDPHPFTHQGQDWSKAEYEKVTNLPFEEKEADAVKARLGKAAAWAKKLNVPLMIGEYGAYPEKMQRGTRKAYLNTVLEAVNKSDGSILGALLWGFQERSGLGVTRGEVNGKMTLKCDAETEKVVVEYLKSRIKFGHIYNIASVTPSVPLQPN